MVQCIKYSVSLCLNQGFFIPKGWTVNYNIQFTHDQSPCFPDKSSFNPDRWSHLHETQDCNLDPRFAFHYLPFGVGTHCCVGKDYARTLIRVFLIQLVSRLEWELITTDPCMLKVPVIKPKTGLWVNVWPRSDK